MKDDKKLEVILDRFYNRFNKFNSNILEMLGERIKEFEGLTPSEAHKLGQEIKYSTDIKEIEKELSRISGKSIKEIDELFERMAKENVEFAEAYNEELDYESNDRLRRYVETIKSETNQTFKNISKSKNIGFTFKDKDNNVIFKPLKTTYRELIDEAVYNVSTGVVDYQSAMRSTIRQLADSGVKIHEETTTYKSGYNRRIDSSVRQAVLTGVRRVNIGIQEMVGEEIGADGVQVSFHVPCAEDHWEINGRQFSNKRFERINSNLDRPVGELNCTHFIFSIVLGVSEPDYSDEYLEKMRKRSKEKLSYKNKEYTPYEAQEVQRRLETEIRKQKDRQIIGRSSGNEQEIMKAQKKITQLTKEYYNFSKAMGLDTYKNRMSVSQYHRVNVKKLK